MSLHRTYLKESKEPARFRPLLHLPSTVRLLLRDVSPVLDLHQRKPLPPANMIHSTMSRD
ncbi:hypothetical protein UPYG_G00001830 [Umbra pygmaea]|uniref:Uncharacterized protein n=1 Tax=Umbra pygmaea TaxID=75934 RepID=A0ABD0XGJ8_UMBPY